MKMANCLFTKMIKSKNNIYYFDIKSSNNGGKILEIIKTSKNNGNQNVISLKETELDLLLTTLKELKPLLSESFHI